MRSLRLRLLLGAAIGVGSALAIAGVVLVAMFGAHVERRYIKELEDHLLQLAAVIQLDTSGTVTLKHDLSDPEFQKPLSGLYWWVVEQERTKLGSRSLWDSGLSPPPFLTREPAAFSLQGPSGQQLVVIGRTIHWQNRTVGLAVAGDRKVVEEAKADFARVVAMALVVLGGLLTAASWMQVGAGLAPLRTLRDQLDSLRRGEAKRIEGAYPTELAGLVQDLNGLIATQAREVERARSNAGKLGHALKTPLALLSAEARTLREKGEAAAADTIDAEIAAMNAEVARILAAVRAVGPRRAVGTATSLKDLIERLVGTMKRLPNGQAIDWSIRTPSESISVPIDHRDLDDVFGNLLDNARKWAESQIRISIGPGHDTVEVVVEDDGPGIPPERQHDVLASGVRLDPSVSGTGIGLAIARDLVELNGGRVSLDKSELGGLRLTVSLARADRAADPLNGMLSDNQTGVLHTHGSIP